MPIYQCEMKERVNGGEEETERRTNVQITFCLECVNLLGMNACVRALSESN